MKQINSFLLTCAVAMWLNGCNQGEKDARFRNVPSAESGVEFVNDLKETVDFNIFSYMYFYNGGGVAVGDLNGDGLMDLYFTSNQQPNKLYLNLGNLNFQDISKEAGVEGFNSWTTGVTMADVNGDGLLDIYVSYLGDYLEFKSQNQLFINTGNNEDGLPVFEDRAGDYGLNLIGFSTQAVFFDYDLDGDLDMFMLNHSVHNNGTFGKSSLRETSHPLAGDKLLRNDGGNFVEVTASSGIYSSAIGYGLGVVVADVNLDGYPDIYVGNDFHENDYQYINNGDGTFTNQLASAMMHTSHFSMGVDFGDINNDGFPELVTLDMLPNDPKILKASAAEDPYDVYNFKLNYGYTHQFARNTLQLNNGNGTFSEIGMMAGIHATDWSWSTFFADFDLDGYKDLYVANGILRRSNDLDYINFITDEEIQYRLGGNLTEKELALTENMPTIKLPNYVFKNNGDLTFSDISKDWGLDVESYSNGAAYVDLDNDGDLDIVVNNINDKAFILENQTISTHVPSSHGFLKMVLIGKGQNHFGIGARVLAYTKGEMQIQENNPVRGFQSASDYRLNFGFGKADQVDSLIIVWPDFTFQVLEDIPLNQTLKVHQEEARGKFDYGRFHPTNSLVENVTQTLQIDFKHEENLFNEFTREPLIPHMLSAEGPAAAVADINGDGLEDIFIGGAKHQPGRFFLQDKEGDFSPQYSETVSLDSLREDVSAIFADFNNNGFPDLMVVSGGNEFSGNSIQNSPRLYLNDGKGHFSASTDFPEIYLTGSVVAAGDFDHDGDLDLFIGARTTPWQYGVKASSYLLKNDGKGNFTDVTRAKAPELLDYGFVKDAKWVNLNKGEYPDLVIASEWAPITIFRNNGGSLKILPLDGTGLEHTHGWWNTIVPGDFDGDGRMDFIAGNLGLNSKLKASLEEPLRMYVADFDQNGTKEQILSHFMKGKEYPFHTRDELFKQIPSLKKDHFSYTKFAEADLGDLFAKGIIEKADLYEAYQLRSLGILNLGDYRFKVDTLPLGVQASALMTGYFDEDSGYTFLGGNFYPVNVQMGRYDASWGSVLKFDPEENRFVLVLPTTSGLSIQGETRKILPIKIKGKDHFIFIKNNEKPEVVTYNDIPVE